MERILWSMGTHITERLTDALQRECPCTMWRLLFCKRSSLLGCIEYLMCSSLRLPFCVNFSESRGTWFPRGL
jgi:hypothetical protein